MYEVFERLCREKGVSSYRVSKDTSISTATLSDWKTGKSHPKADKIQTLADYFGVTPEYFRTGENKPQPRFSSEDLRNAILRYSGKDISKGIEEMLENELDGYLQSVRIPIVRKVAAGIPIDSEEQLIKYEEISEELENDGVSFGLQIQGDSMEPGIQNGDIVLVREQPTAETGQIVVALVNGNDGCCKRFKQYEDGSIALMSDNPQYPPMYFNGSEIDDMPIKICGVVKELRRRF